MPWKRNDPDPLEIKRRKLAEQERQIAEQMSRLADDLHASGEPVPEEVKRPEPPVWRMEDEHTHSRAVEPTPARKRHLARQRQRDMIWFFAFVPVMLLVLYMIWCIYVQHAQ